MEAFVATPASLQAVGSCETSSFCQLSNPNEQTIYATHRGRTVPSFYPVRLAGGITCPDPLRSDLKIKLVSGGTQMRTIYARVVSLLIYILDLRSILV